MGVPAMFRWLSQKYPKIVSGVIEEVDQEINGVTVPVDRTGPNPNGECDNLYLDMNGIVHPCSHPEDKPAPETEADMMRAIFEYTDRVCGMARPRKILYLAVDGVAPRAKMNQQRSRRFRSAREAKEKDEARAEFQKLLKQQALARGEDIMSIDEVIKKTWDSNAITPGTPFMFLLASSLQYWCAYKFTTDPSWLNLKVIISDASVPGEGEHKIMNFIRSQRAMESHDPNTRHVIYGLDADLIMLGLATHEPHFRVLREDVFADSHKDKLCNKCGRKGHGAVACQGKPALTDEEKAEEALKKPASAKPFIWLHVSVLREYLAIEMDSRDRKFKYDLERALDDWVFMCFFVGNDFLPHLPSLEIRDQGIELLIGIWRDLIGKIDDYITKDGFPNMKRVSQVLRQLGHREAGIFRKRKEQEDRQKARQQQRDADKASRERNGNGHGNGNGQPAAKRRKEDTSTYMDAGITFFAPGDAQSNAVRNATNPFGPKQDNAHAGGSLNIIGANDDRNKSAAAVLKQKMKADAKGQAQASLTTSVPGVSVSLGKRKSSAMDDDASAGEKGKADNLEESENGTPGRSTPLVHENTKPKAPSESEDLVRLFEPGYVHRYYEQKFKCKGPEEIAAKQKEVATHYAEGLCWVLAYYMQGCPSWTWYYPEHYAPFATDFELSDIASINPVKLFSAKHGNHQLGEPFKPYEQLMAVLPVASNHAIPEPFRGLMTDPKSGIADYYPEDFVIDLNGAKQAWRGVALLPFIDEKILLSAMGTKYPELSDDEEKRNSTGRELLMFSQSATKHQLYGQVKDAFFTTKRLPPNGKPINPLTSQKLHGVMFPHDTHVVDSRLEPPFDLNPGEEEEYIQDQSLRIYYEMPEVESKKAHKSILLPGVSLPRPLLTEDDKRAIASRTKGNRPPYNNPRPPYNNSRTPHNGNNGGQRMPNIPPQLTNGRPHGLLPPGIYAPVAPGSGMFTQDRSNPNAIRYVPSGNSASIAHGGGSHVHPQDHRPPPGSYQDWDHVPRDRHPRRDDGSNRYGSYGGARGGYRY